MRLYKNGVASFWVFATPEVTPRGIEPRLQDRKSCVLTVRRWGLTKSYLSDQDTRVLLYNGMSAQLSRGRSQKRLACLATKPKGDSHYIGRPREASAPFGVRGARRESNPETKTRANQDCLGRE